MHAKRWLMQYGVAVALAVLFAAIFGHVPLFRETAIGSFRASNLVQFIGYAAALITIVIGSRQIATDQSDDWIWLGPFRKMVLPASTLVVLPLAYTVLLLMVGPVLGGTGKSVYNWGFVIGIIAASCWVIVVWVQKCAPRLVHTESTHKEREQAA